MFNFLNPAGRECFAATDRVTFERYILPDTDSIIVSHWSLSLLARGKDIPSPKLEKSWWIFLLMTKNFMCSTETNWRIFSTRLLNATRSVKKRSSGMLDAVKLVKKFAHSSTEKQISG